MLNILAVLLGIAAVAVYLKGVRYDKPGANPAFVLLVVAAVVSVLLPFTGIPERLAQRRQIRALPESMEFLGRHLSNHVSEGMNVLLVAEDDGERSGLERALERGTGVDLNFIGFAIVGGEGTADDINDAVDPYENEGIDLIVAITRLPESYVYENDDIVDVRSEVRRLSFLNWDPVPMFAVDLGAGHDENLENEIAAGRVTVGVYKEDMYEVPILVAVDEDGYHEETFE